MLVFEDVHWADRSSRDFLAFFVRNARHQRVLLVATYRTDELHRRHPLRALVAEAERAPIVERVALERFTREEIVAQLTGILGRRPEARLVDELFARAEGNPFFTEELAAAATGERLPANVADALMLRVEALSPAAQAALRLAAVAGPRVSHGLLERAAGVAPDELVAGLREAVAHNIVVVGPRDRRLRLPPRAHARGAGRRPAPGRARAAARRAGPRAGGRSGAVGLPQRRRPPSSPSTGSRRTTSRRRSPPRRRPAPRPSRLAAFAEANAHYERAIELWDGVPEDVRAAGPSLVDLIRSAADAAHLAGEYARAAALARRALSLVDADADPMTAALIGERLGRYLWISGNSLEAPRECRAAVARLPPDGDPAGRARVLGSEGHLLLLLGRGAEALELCEPALEIARAAGARREEGSILSTMCAALSYTGALDAGIEHGHEAMRIARERNDIEEITRAYVNLGETLDWAGRIEEAADLAGEGALSAIEQGISPLAALLASDQALRLLRLGRWDDADAALAIAIDAAISGVTAGAALAGRALLDALRGRFDESPTRPRGGRARAGERPRVDVDRAAGHHAGRARALERAPRRGARRHRRHARPRRAGGRGRLLPHARPRGRGAGRRRHRRLGPCHGDAEAEREAGAFATTLVDRARHVVRPEAFPAGRCPPESLLNVATTQAEHARAVGQGAAAAWREVAARWDAFGAPYATAYARWRLTEAILADGGARADAQAALAAAHAVALRLRARPLAAELEALATRARLSLDSAGAPAPVTAGGDGAAERVGLTARELEVLRLVAAGETNRSIGQALYISEKTVSVHISRILAKLDVRGRVEAAGLALRLGLLEETEAAPESLGRGGRRRA